jgi:hypothetical protein
MFTLLLVVIYWGQGVDNPIILAGLKAAEFVVNDGSAGTWLVMKGA